MNSTKIGIAINRDEKENQTETNIHVFILKKHNITP